MRRNIVKALKSRTSQRFVLDFKQRLTDADPVQLQPKEVIAPDECMKVKLQKLAEQCLKALYSTLCMKIWTSETSFPNGFQHSLPVDKRH